MKHWHRKIHLVIWIILALLLAVVFRLGYDFVQNKDPWSNASEQIELFDEWERGFNDEDDLGKDNEGNPEAEKDK